MTRLWYILIALISCLLAHPSLASEGQSSDHNMKDQVVVIPIGETSLTNSQSFGFITRILKQAQNDHAKAIIFDLNTPGGLAWETSELMMKVLHPIKVPTYAFVNPKAMSAGALISASCDSIYMTPVSSIGAAGIVNGTGETMDPVMRKKVESAFSAFTRSVVEEKGHNTALIKAMMIPSEKEQQFGSISLPKGELLTLTGKEATSVDPTDPTGKPLLSKGIVSDIPALLRAEKITAPIIIATPSGFERIALWIAWASPVLILIGMAAIYFEMKTPGFGIGGIIAIIAFGLFFFGNNIAGNLAGYETIAMFIIGIGLILVEIFLLPGIFISGTLGVILILLSLFGGMVSGADLDHLFRSGDWTGDALLQLTVIPLYKLAFGLVGGTVAIMALMRYLPETRLFKQFANAVTSGGPDGEAVGNIESRTISKGARGITITELKPNGKATFDGAIYEVSSREGILPKGTPIIIYDKRAFDILVNRAEPIHSESSAIPTTTESDN
ncbi:MAG: hypothetical protein RR250_05770 [Akkermansia sp.]